MTTSQIQEFRLGHGERIVDGIVVKYLCQPCPQCTAKLQAAEEMAKAAKLTFDSFGNKSLRIKGYEALQAALTAWNKAGKREP